MKRARSFAFTLVVFLGTAPTQAQCPPTVTGISPGAAQSELGGVRPQPDVFPAQPVRALVTDGATGEAIPNSKLTFTTIDVPGAGFTAVFGINTDSQLVGFYSPGPESGLACGFMYSNGVFTYFDYPGSTFTEPRGINDSGLIVGESIKAPRAVGFLYDGTTFTTLHDGGASATYGEGLNNAGVVVGGEGSAFATKAFELRNSIYKRINFPGTYGYGFANGINNLGQVVGYAGSDSYLYGQGQFLNIDFPGATTTSAYGINDGGLIVGWYAVGTASTYAFGRAKGKYISFSYPGALQTYASGVNASGQAVGEYTFDQQTYHGFVTSPLTPADFGEPEP